LRLLRVLHLVQPANTHHLQVAGGGMSTQMIRRRIRILRDLRMVRVHVPRMAGPNWLTLGSKAPAELERAFELPAEGCTVPRGIGRVQLNHHGGMVAFYVALLAATTRSSHLELVDFYPEAALRRLWGTPAKALVPDAVAVLGVGEARFSLSVEVDTGSERSPAWVAERKAVPYASRWTVKKSLMGAETWGVVLLTPSERRSKRLVRAFWEADTPTGLFWFGVTHTLDPKTLLGPTWQTLRLDDDGQRVRLALHSPFTALGHHASQLTRKTVPAVAVTDWNSKEAEPSARNLGGYGS